MMDVKKYGDNCPKKKFHLACLNFSRAVEDDYKNRQQELAAIYFRELKKQSQKK